MPDVDVIHYRTSRSRKASYRLLVNHPMAALKTKIMISCSPLKNFCPLIQWLSAKDPGSQARETVLRLGTERPTNPVSLI